MSEIKYPQDVRPANLPKGNWVIENGSWVLRGVMSVPLIPFIGAWKLIEIGSKTFWKLSQDNNSKRPLK